MANEIPDSNIILDYNNKIGISLLELKHTTQEEVLKYLNSISDSKATSEDGIPIRFLKMTPDISSRIIAHIINLTIDSNKIPSGWKKAVITPRFKEGDRNLASNYRPI